MQQEMIRSFDPIHGACALLMWFDAELLLELGYDADAVAELLSSDMVAPVAQMQWIYRFDPSLCAPAISWLREVDAASELAIHDRAFRWLLRRLVADPAGPRADVDEDHCFYHLDRLFYLLAPRYAWSTISAYLLQVQHYTPQAPHHVCLLMFYEGSVALNTKQHERAEALLNQALANPEISIALQARILNALALSELYRNAYPRALRHFDQAYTRAQAGNDLFFQGAALVNMSMVYNDLGDPAEGLRLCQQGLAIFQQLNDPHRQAIALYELGNNALYLGRWSAAQSYLDQAIALNIQLGLDARLIHAYWCRGLLCHFLGDLGLSEQYYRDALVRAQSLTNGDTKLASDVLWHLGFLYATQQRWDEALVEYTRALDLIDDYRPHWRSIIGYQRGKVFEMQGRYAEAKQAYGKAIETLEALRQDTDDEQVKIKLLGTTQQLYESMVLLCIDHNPGDGAEAFSYVERARSRAFLDAMTFRAPEHYRSFVQPVVDLDELQAALPEDAVLIEYYTTGVLPIGEHALTNLAPAADQLRAYVTLPPRIILFVITRQQCSVHIAPWDPNDIPAPDDPLMQHKLLQPDLRSELYDALIGPVAEQVRRARLLYLVPHGPLHYVAFGALQGPDGTYLLNDRGPALALAPSATVLLRTLQSRPVVASTNTLAIGYNEPQGRALTYAEAEASLIAAMTGGRAWVGAEPKRSRLLTAASDVRLLHIACHGDYDALDPLASTLSLSRGDILSAQTIIEQLTLRCDLVTLSACTSGLSHVASGDELLGMPRALLYAGASAVICSLWEADDLVAFLVMYHLYTALRIGERPAEALRQALVRVRQLTGAEITTLFDELRARWPEALGAVPRPSFPAALAHHAAFASPHYWATFLYIGCP